MKSRRIVLAARPQGLPKPADFRMEEAELPPLDDGEVLLAIQYLSLDPYMRGRMDDVPAYERPANAIGSVMEGGTVATVRESRHRDYQAGETVLSEATVAGLTVPPAAAALPPQLVKGRDTPVIAFKIARQDSRTPGVTVA